MSVVRAVLSVLGAVAVATAAVTVVTTAPAAADDTVAVIRSAHFSPDTAGVDVYLKSFAGGTTQLWVTDEGYGSFSAYQRIAPGAYVVSMRPHDAPESTPPVLTWTLDAKAGAAYTAAAIGTSASLQAVLLSDDLTPPAADTGRVRIVQAASAAPSVSVQANGGIALVDKLPFGSTSPYTVVPTGAWDVRATADSGGAAAVTSSVAVAPGSSSTVVVLDAPGGGLRLTAVQDSASSAVMPVGSVNAGGGGTATDFVSTPVTSGTSTPQVLGGVLGALAIAVCAGVCRTSRRRRAAA